MVLLFSSVLFYFYVIFSFFFATSLSNYREVQAAMQMSQSWEESLSLVRFLCNTQKCPNVVH